MLKVCEIFGPTIQGEGPTAGKIISFVRLSFCNLRCVWCDTKYTWTAENVMEMTALQVVVSLELQGVKAVAISGGEPLLQQDQLVELLELLRASDYWIEIETNGTIIPLPRISQLVHQFNCSIKLSNSGMLEVKRLWPDAIKTFAASPRSCFKFVVSAREDISEILALVGQYKLKRVYLMPEGQTKEELEQHERLTRELCEMFNFSFSPRLHITQFGGVRGR